MRFLLACLFIGLYSVSAQPIIGTLNRPFNQPFNQPIAAANNPFAANSINHFAVNNPLAGLQQPFNNPVAAAAAAAGPAAAGFPLNQPVLSGLNQPLLPGLNQLNQPLLNQINQPMMGLNALNNPLAQQQAFPQPQFFVQQAFPQQASLSQQALPQQNLLQQQPIVGAAPQIGGLNLAGLTDQQIQQLAMQAAQPTLTQWLANDHQAIFQRAGALNNLPPINQQPITAAGGPLQGVQAIQAMPNTLAALQQQMQQPLTQNLLQLNPNLAQWMQQQQLAMQQAVRGPSPAPVAAAASAPPAQQFPIPGNSPVGQFQVDQGPLTGANPQAIMMPSMQSRPSPQSQNINQPILQGGSLPLQQPSLNAPDLQDFTLTPSGPAPQQPIDPQRPASAPQPILNQAGPTSMNPSGPQPLAPQLSPIMNQGMPNMNNPMNAPRPRP